MRCEVTTLSRYLAERQCPLRLFAVELDDPRQEPDIAQGSIHRRRSNPLRRRVPAHLGEKGREITLDGARPHDEPLPTPPKAEP